MGEGGTMIFFDLDKLLHIFTAFFIARFSIICLLVKNIKFDRRQKSAILFLHNEAVSTLY